ncbi:cytochrome P450 71D11-like [Humulus lupulus]|uniref:cytochrome P450 71D11-like n=1 Tax=Humulus lupulus TaxID=3486 RepID=UPI002B41142E|nr:cytochrome P450 71D11-like [Humulus lupulus]
MELQLPSFPIIFSSSIFLFIVVSTLKKRTKTKSTASTLPPGPWQLPFVGNILQLLGSLPHHALRDLAKNYGPFMYLRFGEVPTIVVSSPEYAKEVMRNHDATFASRPQSLFSQIMLYGNSDIAFAPYGEYWRQLRKLCMKELLSTARVRSFRHIREEEMHNLKEWIASNVGSAIDLSDRIQTSTYGVTARAAFGKKSKDHEEFISIVEESIKLGGGFKLTDLFPSFNFLALISHARAKIERQKHRAERIIENIIQEHKEKNKSSVETAESETHEDFVDVLLKFHNKDDLGFSLTSNNVKAIIWDIFSAGSETSATAVDWAMVEIIRNPRVMKRAQEEVREVFNRKGTVDEEGVADMKYLKSLVKETLRLHPSNPLLLPRESREKCVINGYEIPVKTRIIVNAWAIGRDPKYWSEPESFIPERFLDSTIDFKGGNFEYIPFGAGRRICPGMSFGLINIELPLAILLYHFDWKLPNGMSHEDLDMTECFGVTVRRKDHLVLIPIVHDISCVEKSKSG